MARKRKSEVWTYFKEYANNKKTARCNLCLSEVNRYGNTTNLYSHLKIHHSIVYSLLKKSSSTEKDSDPENVDDPEVVDIQITPSEKNNNLPSNTSSSSSAVQVNFFS